jgi:hypothetical protein
VETAAVWPAGARASPDITEYEVGVAAGRIWDMLKAGGALTTAQLIEALRLSAEETGRGVGWLLEQGIVECGPGSCGAVQVARNGRGCTDLLAEEDECPPTPAGRC